MTPPVSSVPVILEKTAARRMVWVDVARVVACILIIANHMAFYSAELYRWIWAEFLAARTPFFLLAAGYFVGRGSFGPLDGGSLSSGGGAGFFSVRIWCGGWLRPS